jgi:hypothetical protein
VGRRGRIVTNGTARLLAARFLLGVALAIVSVGSATYVPPASAAAGAVPAAAAGVSFEFYDFFNVPYGEWWDYRARIYGDAPINAECFSAIAIVDGVCTPTIAAVPDVAAFPYTHWRPFSESIDPANPSSNPFVFAPHRMRAVGTGVAGYTLQEPVFLPVLDYGAAAGARLDFDWRLQYLDRAGADALAAAGCPVSSRSLDGFVVRSQVSLTMDLPESRRVFNVEAADPTQASAWWASNADPTCLGQGPVEVAVHEWFLRMGGSEATPGKYDVASATEYFYRPFYTQIAATVDPTGLTRVTVDHVAWGTEVLLARMFYWGNTSYKDRHLASPDARGWSGLEPWFEDLAFQGSLRASGVDLTFTAAVPYLFEHLAAPGPNGQLDRTDDEPLWAWGPTLLDRRFGWGAAHPHSELDRYPAPAAYVRSTPGSRQYGASGAYDHVPVAWDLPEGTSWAFRFPTNAVVLYDPNLTPVGADPRGGYVAIATTLEYLETVPATYGAWDAGKTWEVLGPATTGGPEGSPGPDGVPGTADDQYALEPWGTLHLGPNVGPAHLRVTTNPPVAGKIFVDGIPRDEWGLSWVKLPSGPHTVSFGALYGLGTPGAVPVVLRSGRTASVRGDYEVYGSLRVTTEPALSATIYVNGEPANDWGVWRAVPAGTYTIAWGKVANYDPPPPQTVTVRAGETLVVNGRFASNPAAKGPDPATFGYLRVTTRPAVPAQIVANGVPRDEWGLTWVKVAPGDYSITFTGVYGHTSPAAATVRVLAGETATYEGVFQAHGSLRVLTSPALPATIFVDGVPRNDWGMWQSMPPGTYTVGFEPLAGYTTPAAQTVTVAAGTLTTVTGRYTTSSAGSEPTAPLPDPTPQDLGFTDATPGDGDRRPRRGRP